MDEITLTIDGQQVKAKAGMTVLEAAREAGIYIPTLCYHPDLAPHGGCRLCMVEIEKMRGLPTSCTTPATDGMVVRTNTPQIQELRRNILELILTEHPNLCLTCDRKERCQPFDICLRNTAVTERCVLCPKNGQCELQEVADYIGIEEVTLPYAYKELPVHREDPLFDRDYNLCILCGRCVRACQELRGVAAIAFIHRGSEALVGTAFDRSLLDSGCKFCCACVEVCPTGALMDRGAKWETIADREAFLVPCKHTCPLEIDVPRYVRLIGERKFAEALAVVAEKTPFPLICGLVCHHPCEGKCRRGEVNEPIAIMALKRFVAERAPKGGVKRLKPVPATGKRVAVIGSGPAGLTAAYYLARLCGHSATVFEALPEPGGMMRVGIPEYRLPKKLLDSEIDLIRNSGVEIRTNTKIDSLDELFEQGFDAVFMATGAHRDVKIGLKGEEGGNILQCISFLRRVNSGERVKMGNRVVVVGGELGALDAARIALRLGAKEATVIYSGTKEEMPGIPPDIEEAQKEGAKLLFLASPTKIVSGKGVVQVEWTDLKAEQKHSLEADTVIVAGGRMPEIPEGFGLEVAEGNTLSADPETLTTSREGIFAGGDVADGPTSVTQAMAAGRRAAVSIDKFLGGSGAIDEVLAPVEEPVTCLGRDEGFGYQPRQQMPELPTGERLNSFAQVELGFSEEMAVTEAKRCLRCDLRLQLGKVKTAPVKEQLEETLASYVR